MTNIKDNTFAAAIEEKCPSCGEHSECKDVENFVCPACGWTPV